MAQMRRILGDIGFQNDIVTQGAALHPGSALPLQQLFKAVPIGQYVPNTGEQSEHAPSACDDDASSRESATRRDERRADNMREDTAPLPIDVLQQ